MERCREVRRRVVVGVGLGWDFMRFLWGIRGDVSRRNELNVCFDMVRDIPQFVEVRKPFHEILAVLRRQLVLRVVILRHHTVPNPIAKKE